MPQEPKLTNTTFFLRTFVGANQAMGVGMRQRRQRYYYSTLQEKDHLHICVLEDYRPNDSVVSSLSPPFPPHSHRCCGTGVVFHLPPAGQSYPPDDAVNHCCKTFPASLGASTTGPRASLVASLQALYHSMHHIFACGCLRYPAVADSCSSPMWFQVPGRILVLVS